MLNNKKDDSFIAKITKSKISDITKSCLEIKPTPKELDSDSDSFNKVIEMLLDYKRKYVVVDIPAKLKEGFIQSFTSS